MLKWLRLLNPVAQRDAERAFWAIMFLPDFTACVRSELLHTDGGLTRSTVVRISQEVAMRIAKDNFESGSGFIAKAELMNAANNLDYSSKAIAMDVCRGLDTGKVERKISNPLVPSQFDKLVEEMFMISADRALRGAREGHLKFSEPVVYQMVLDGLAEITI